MDLLSEDQKDEYEYYKNLTYEEYMEHIGNKDYNKGKYKIDKDYLNVYNTNIQNILQQKDLISGSHHLNMEKVNLWINSQLTERRRKAAKNLIDNTHYITFNELFEDIRNAVIQIYSKLNLNQDIYMFIGRNNKSSFYFIGMIALYFIKLLNYKIPIFITGFKAGVQNIVFDDVSYTGGQFEVILSWDSPFLSHIYFGLSGMTEKAKIRLENLKFLEETHINIVNIYVFPQKTFKNLNEILNKQDYYDLIYYFSPYTNGLTNISLYLDIKIADAVSTFLKVLNYGPVLPLNLNYNYDLLKNSFIINEQIATGFMNEKDFEKYYDDIIKEESNNVILKKESYNKIFYIPFIQNCESNVLKIIKESNITYNILMFTNNCLQNNPLIYNGSLNKKYENWRHIVQTLNEPNNRCPVSFYKNLF
jgi:hypothetical protein